MDEMVAADSGGIAVAHDGDDRQPWLCQLDSGGKGQGPAVGRVQSVEIDIGRHPA